MFLSPGYGRHFGVLPRNLEHLQFAGFMYSLRMNYGVFAIVILSLISNPLSFYDLGNGERQNKGNLAALKKIPFHFVVINILPFCLFYESKQSKFQKRSVKHFRK